MLDNRGGAMQGWASVIAVAGTLLGVFITLLFQRWNTERTLREARFERARKEFLDGIVAVSSEATTLRRAEYDRWKSEQRFGDSQHTYEARQEVYRQRVIAANAMYRVWLLAAPGQDDELVAHIRQTVELCGHVADADTLEALKVRNQEAEASVERLIEIAAPLLRVGL